jgi:hypothetical protein
VKAEILGPLIDGRITEFAANTELLAYRIYRGGYSLIPCEVPGRRLYSCSLQLTEHARIEPERILLGNQILDRPTLPVMTMVMRDVKVTPVGIEYDCEKLTRFQYEWWTEDADVFAGVVERWFDGQRFYIIRVSSPGWVDNYGPDDVLRSGDDGFVAGPERYDELPESPQKCRIYGGRVRADSFVSAVGFWAIPVSSSEVFGDSDAGKSFEAVVAEVVGHDAFPDVLQGNYILNEDIWDKLREDIGRKAFKALLRYYVKLSSIQTSNVDDNGRLLVVWTSSS